MNIMSLGIGEGKVTYLVIQSIMKKSPIICRNEEIRKSLVRNGKLISSKLDPDGKLNMPIPVTYEEFESGNFNRSLEYIFDSINDYFNYKNIKVRTLCVDNK